MAKHIRYSSLSALLLLAGIPWQAAAQDASHITIVKLYPGAAIVERVADIGASTTHVSFACLPATLDESSVEITASNGAQLGETAIATNPSGIDGPCTNSALAKQIKTLQHQKDVLTVRLDALQDSRNFLKNLGSGENARLGGGTITGTVQSVTKASEDIGARKLDVQTQIDVLDQTLGPLLAEQKRTQPNVDMVKTVSVDVRSNASAQLHLTYRISGPGWTPSYRATLNTDTGAVSIERLALVAQASGEDWTNAHLTLFSGQPGRNLAPRDPASWQLSMAAQFTPQPMMRAMAAPAAAPAPPAPRAAPSAGAPLAPLYDVRSFTGNYDAQFDIFKPITVPSNGQKVSLSLGRYVANAKSFVEITPANSTSAFLMADMDAPDGIWLPGNMDLYRDNNYAGQTYFRPANKETQSLSFGQDGLVTAQIMPQRTHQGSAGFLEQDGERQIEHRYLIASRHTRPIAVHVLEPTPVSQDDKIKVENQFNVTPDEKDWQGMPGVVLWRLTLDPGKQQELTGDYRITYPKDEHIIGLR